MDSVKSLPPKKIQENENPEEAPLVMVIVRIYNDLEETNNSDMEEIQRLAKNENENSKNTIRLMEAEHLRAIKTFEEQYFKVKIGITKLNKFK